MIIELTTMSSATKPVKQLLPPQFPLPILGSLGTTWQNNYLGIQTSESSISLSPFLSLPLSLQPPLSWYHIKPDVKMCPNLRKVLDEDVLPFII